MSEKEDYLTAYRVFFEKFAATVNPEDQLPVQIAGYTITESELPGEVLYWTTQYLTEKQCPPTLMTPLRRIILDEVRIASKKHPNEFGYKSDEAVYIALRLMQAVTARVNDVCLRYLDNSQLDSLPPPPPPAQRDLKTVSCATKNSRRVMEDRHVEIGNLEALFDIETTEPTSFYAVYDGHAGSAAATYCAAHLHQYLVESPHFTTDLRKAMRDAFLRTDAEFVRKSNQERACGGSTAVAVCVRARRLVAAWAGDSLALLAKRLRLMQLVRPHKPARQDERDRIESSGGTVMFWGTWRVNGQLAVSRAIGDAQYKPYVTARPEIATVDLDGDEDFVVVACDGLWDFVSEDDVALAVYRQLAIDPNDLQAVTKRLILQAKRQGSADNISIIVVFLKDPHDIAADNCPPMDLGLDNAVVNAPPFTVDADACKRQDATAAVGTDSSECADGEAEAEAADNGVDNSDSDSEDLGPETAVDVDDLDADTRNQEPAPPTPPAHTVEASHVDGALVDNVAESGEDSEDEWNYFKGEGEREHNPGDEPDDPLRSETPCQDNSAWESSSVDMNSSPLNPDAPVFVPGTVGADVLLAESPRKPLPMDDIELPDVAQFETGADVRPAELLNLDNCDQLNGHHNLSIDDTAKEKFNGNEKFNMDSLGFGFNVDADIDKVRESELIQDFERIQKDTTDFCNIQVFEAHSESNPFASESNDELFERLKNKERDPMSMSFYQEKDDDTCERLSKNELVDLNAVQPLPESDDEDVQTNGICDNSEESEKENVSPDQNVDLLGGDVHEPNNDIVRFEQKTDILSSNMPNFGHGDNFTDYNVTNTNMPAYSNIEFEAGNIPQDTVLQTDTPESHKLLFEQIPEIPDGKSSELGFVNDDILDPSESDKDGRVFTPQDETSQDVEMESKIDDSPSAEDHPLLTSESKEQTDKIHSPEPNEVSNDVQENDMKPQSPAIVETHSAISDEGLAASPICQDHIAETPISPEPAHNVHEKISVDIHQHSEIADKNIDIDDFIEKDINTDLESDITIIEDDTLGVDTELHLQSENLIGRSPVPTESPLPARSPLPVESHVLVKSPVMGVSPHLDRLTEPLESPVPAQSPSLSQSPMPAQETVLPGIAASIPSPVPELGFAPSPVLEISLEPAPEPVAALAPSPGPPTASSPSFDVVPSLGPVSPSPSPAEPTPVAESIQVASVESVHSPSPDPELHRKASPLPAEVPLPRESPLPTESPLPIETLHPPESPLSAVSPITTEHDGADNVVPSISDRIESSFSRPETASPVDVEPPQRKESAADRYEDRATPVSRLTSESLAELEKATSKHEEPSIETATGPTPDIVPEERAELITDIDIGIPESRAQEICVPVTDEIRFDDTVLTGVATPPPTPAAESTTVAAPFAPAIVVEKPGAADSTAPVVEPRVASPVPADAAPTAAIGAAVAVAAAAAAKAKTPAGKKSPTTPTARFENRTPKSAPKLAANPRTPASAPKKAATPTAATPTAARPASARTPTAKLPTPAARSPAAKPPAPVAKTAPATKPAAASKPSLATAKAASTTRPAAPKTVPAKTSAPASKPAIKISSAPPSGRPAGPARPGAAAPRAPVKAPAAPTAAAPARPSRPTPATAARPRPRAPEKKPLTNGDVKEAKPSAPRAAARAPPARCAPPARSAPKPAVDKASKDLANRRITAKAAPPRTAPTKTAVGAKTTAIKSVPKKSLDSPKKEQIGQTNGLREEEPSKPPPSPPLADNALLPDVIA